MLQLEATIDGQKVITNGRNVGSSFVAVDQPLRGLSMIPQRAAPDLIRADDVM